MRTFNFTISKFNHYPLFGQIAILVKRTYLQIADPLKQSLRCENKVHLLGHLVKNAVTLPSSLALFTIWFMGSAPFTKSSVVDFIVTPFSVYYK